MVCGNRGVALLHSNLTSLLTEPATISLLCLPAPAIHAPRITACAAHLHLKLGGLGYLAVACLARSLALLVLNLALLLPAAASVYTARQHKKCSQSPNNKAVCL